MENEPESETGSVNQRLELRPEMSHSNLESKLSEITRKKPKFKKIEKSSVLSKVKAFIPQMKNGEVDLWKQMKTEV